MNMFPSSCDDVHCMSQLSTIATQFYLRIAPSQLVMVKKFMLEEIIPIFPKFVVVVVVPCW